MTVRIFIDGSCKPNPGHMGIGVVIEWKLNNPKIISEYIGEGTNNIAEYEALHRALQFIYDEQIMDVEINSDSNLMVNQVNGNWKVNNKELKELCSLAQRKIQYLESKNYKIKLFHIKRDFNLADKPANNAVDRRE